MEGGKSSESKDTVDKSDDSKLTVDKSDTSNLTDGKSDASKLAAGKFDASKPSKPQVRGFELVKTGILESEPVEARSD